ncbi:alpha/beta fold hydrolase [Agromyces humatus]|uniref:HTH luxR-type domain-containing protein n=1 Tax=Agromyces humatus TaxID=279573 RepID=A0ABP4X6H5_9MICO|nr:alpha/beta fold hydrolase [Agromyces humatus]
MGEPRQRIRFCQAADGVRIALAEVGEGPPLVKAANYLTHLEFDWVSPVWRHWLAALSSGHRLIRYDERGCGLSDWEVEDFSLNAWVTDLETVVDSLHLEHFPLLGISQGGAVAIAYAVRHPERVSRLVLYGAYAQGRLRRSTTPEQRQEAFTLLDLMRLGWGQDNPAFRQVFTTLFMPDATPEQTRSLNELQRRTTSPANAVLFEEAFYALDVTELARTVSVPTLILHARNDAMIPFEEGRRLAGLIPESTFVPLDSKNHILVEGEPAWTRFVEEIGAFVDHTPTDRGQLGGGDIVGELSPREHEVLELISLGLSNAEIAERLFISPHTLRNHITHVFSKLNTDTRAQAIVMAREAGMGRSGMDQTGRPQSSDIT